MMPSEAESLVDFWSLQDSKVFRVIREFFPNDFIVLRKIAHDTFECLEKQSTMKYPTINSIDLKRELMYRGLVYVEPYTSWLDCQKMKTGGCKCGVWLVGGRHSDWCDLSPQYKKK
jgi:hypothetical protein